MALYTDSSFPANIDATPSNNATISTTNLGSSSQQLIAANPDRQGFSVYNNSSKIIYLGINSNVSTSSNFFARIPANGLYEWTFPSIYKGAVFAIANSNNVSCQVLELEP